MGDALKRLVAWRNAHGEDFASIWQKQRLSGDEEALAVDSARRVVSHHFGHIAQLYKNRFITRKFTKFVANVNGINVWCQIVEPLEEALNENYAKWVFNLMRRLAPKYDDGQVFDSSAPASIQT